MPRIPEETLQQVLAATDIVDLVGRSVKLRRAGTNWVGLCPFHNEKSPSFNVRPSTNSYHCFGCGAGGNAYRFVMEHDGLTFMEAVKRLADSAGIRIEEEVWDANAEAIAKQRTAMIRVHKEISAWYHQLLMKHPMADAARQYLKNRGITAEVAKSWQLGYAPPNTQPLREWAMKNKFGSGLLIEAGILATSEERGDAYPRFRHRLMFPIRNDNGEVIAFSGRVLEADAKAAKYLNSPETLLFNKSKVLFGFDKSKRAISKAGQAIVCEGQIDTLMVFEAGFQNVVAGQGTAFTEFHARALKRQADEVVLCYDSDNAGYKAAERAFQALAPFGLIVKVAMLPKGEDPDSYIRKQGVEAFGALIKEAKDFVDYQWISVGSRRDLTEMRERIKFAEEMAENVKLFDTPMAKETTIQRVARSLGISEEVMRKLVARAEKSTGKAKKETPNERPGEKLLAAQDATALLLCRLAIADAEVLLWLREHGDKNILHDLSGTDLLSRVWLDDYDPAVPDAFNSFLISLDRDEEAAFNQILHMPAPPGNLADAQHAVQILSINRLQQQKQRLQTQLKQPNLDAQEAADIQREIMDLHKELTEAQKSVAPLKGA
ncbi:DNA primase [Prosthecobacter fusiformis]|uniref:DNA primase n=1 Tax=Prosthecobacter fusiformis TaxID=48464 RepID=A0A4R7SNH0_9BACT|nr:DNA primase [Prosthecobacter fusiformis]TDU80710.1 DNA primase [Prosthecobacter fusiformis]